MLSTNYENILKTIKHWPSSERLNLIQDILDTLKPDLEDSNSTLSPVKRPTLPDALGLLATPTPPSDQEVQELLDEHRLEKYG